MPPIVSRTLSNGFLSRVLVTRDIETLVLVVLKHMKPYVLGLVNFFADHRCAQERGWEVLHAIVDSIWIRDREGRSLEEQHQSAMDFRIMCTK